MLNKLNDTIVAVSTARGKSAIGIIRMSGNNALDICSVVIKKKLLAREKYYTIFYNNTDSPIDKGIVLIFKKPYSYTGENLVEFHTHGNDLILNALLNRLVFLGARVAEAGEFSFRAYLNNRIDLLQAESINTLINAKTVKNNGVLLNTIAGELSSKIKNIMNDIMLLRCNLESSIDFPDDVVLKKFDFLNKFRPIYIAFFTLYKHVVLDTNILQSLKIVIIGKSNVGKSSLFNFLVDKSRSIVTNIPGTTRDFLESHMIVKDNIFRVVDTAGFNIDSKCKIEKNGILKSFEQIRLASIIIFMFDITQKNLKCEDKIFNFILNYLSINKNILIVKNKIDLSNKTVYSASKNNFYSEFFISVKEKIGLDLIVNKINNIYTAENGNKYIINKRHFVLFIKIKNEMKILRYLIKIDAEQILLAEILKNIYLLFSELLGKDYSDNLTTKIFSKFCIGK